MVSKAVEYSMMVETPFSSQKWDVSAKAEPRIRRSLTFRAKASLFVAFIIAAVIVCVVVVCFVLPDSRSEEPFWPTYVSNSRLGRYGRAAVSTDAAPCAPIGRDILERGGTAVDAAIAVLVCMGAHNPHSMGLGGGFLMLYYNRTERRTYYIDAREVAPRLATEDMFRGNASQAKDGGLSVAVPGELAGYWAAYEQFGKLPWEELFAPTIEMCLKGIEVGPHLATAIKTTKAKLMQYKDIGKIFLKNGTDVYEAGERIVRTDLARTLQAISKDKMKALYGPSDLATNFLSDMRKAGSIIDRIDMQSYIPRMREPIEVNLCGNTTLYGVSVPGSGALLAFMIAILDGYPDMDKSVVDDRKRAVLAYHRIVEAMKFGYAHRSRMEDEDSEEMKQLIEELTSREYADDVRRRIDDFKTSDDVTFYLGASSSFAEDHGTAHLSIVAPNGDAVSVTSTINLYFGSKVLSPSTGIVLNDEMDDFSSPNITNGFDLPPSFANHIKAGKRPMSSMTPMILVDARGNVTLVLGGNGGTTITSSVLQVFARSFFFGEDMKQSIDAPRIHHQLTPNILHYYEGFPKAFIEELRKFGHKTELYNKISIVMGIQRGDDDYLYANSDYRKSGEVDGF